jgi:hypothetical protein
MRQSHFKAYGIEALWLAVSLGAIGLAAFWSIR